MATERELTEALADLAVAEMEYRAMKTALDGFEDLATKYPDAESVKSKLRDTRRNVKTAEAYLESMRAEVRELEREQRDK